MTLSKQKEIISDYLNGTITTHAHMCITGKPASVISLQNRYVDEAINILKSYDLQWHVKCLDEGWSELWIYNNIIMKEIIECTPNKPKTKFDHWVLGKLFGYSDIEIFKFIKNRGI